MNRRECKMVAIKRQLPSIQLLKSIKLKYLSYVLFEQFRENIKHGLKILFCSLYQQFNWRIISPDPSTVFDRLSNRLFSSPTRAARVTRSVSTCDSVNYDFIVLPHCETTCRMPAS